MNSKSDWKRVTRCRRCPVCGKPDWCLYAGADNQPEAVLCQRIESPRRIGEAGWLHRLRDSVTTWPHWQNTLRRAVRMAIDARGGPDLAGMVERWRLLEDSPRLWRLADSLGVSVVTLRRLGVGWSTRYSAWTFSMSDAGGRIVGIRLRRPDGRKLSVKGGREGLFIPSGLPQASRLLITEGPSDCAALLDLRFAAIGRPSCLGGVRHVINLVRRLAVPEAVIVADSDPPGRRGAHSLASVLAAYCTTVKVITPPTPHKDARAWKQAGATAGDVQAAIDAAPVRRLAVQVRKAGGNHGR
jgi:hypothetical protein